MAISHRACQSCDRQYTPRRSNQKFCRPCRFLKDLEFWAEERTDLDTCTRCDSKYKRFMRKQQVCGKCLTGPWRGTCLACHTKNSDLVRGEIPICWSCAAAHQDGARTYVTETLRRWLGHADVRKHDDHPLMVSIRNGAEAASAALGCSVAEALRRAKSNAGLDPDKPTTLLGDLSREMSKLAGTYDEPEEGI